MGDQILVVDDEEAIVEVLEINLRKAGFAVLSANTGRDALDIAKNKSPKLVILDLMLPDMDGFAVCRALRNFTQTPVMMLTARGEDIDRIVGLELGADDYVVKPFNPREIVARVRAILRRFDKPFVSVESGKFSVEDLVFDVLKRKVWQGDKLVELSPKEFDVFLYLVQNCGALVTRDELLTKVWGSDYVDTRTVDVHVKRVRDKIAPPTSNLIQTVWGKGYKFLESLPPSK